MNTKQQSMAKDLTKGSIALTLIQFAFPLFVSNILQAAYNLVDMVLVGRYLGGTGLSAVSIGGDILHFLTFFAMGFSSAGQVLIARNVGSGDKKEVKNLIGTLFTFLLLVSILISVVCFILRNQILNVINTPAISYQYTMDYTVTCIFGLVFIYGYNIVSAILRGMGDSKRPFAFIAIAAVLNTVLDYIFIVYCNMAVFGAALATVIAQGVSFVVSLIYLYIKRENFGFDFKLESFRIKSDTLRSLVALGIPMAIQSAAISMSKIVLLAWINLEGVVYSALAGIYNKVNVMAGVVSMSFTTAGASMVGQSLGAKKNNRVTGILCWVTVMTIVIYSFAALYVGLNSETVYHIFTSDSSVISVAGILTLPIILNFFGAATRSISFSLINGSGNIKLNLAIALIDGVIARIGLATFMCFRLGMGSYGCWLGDSLAGLMPLIIGIVFYLSGTWKN